MKIKALIVDDEQLARQDLKYLLNENTGIELVGEATNAEEAKQLIEDKQPDLLFLDINMPETTGFELLESLDQTPYVIFVTAYDQYAINAFEANALDYILKPVNPERLQKAVEKLKDVIDQRNSRKSGAQELTADSQVFIKDGERCYFVRLADITMFESAGNYVKVFIKNTTPLLHKSLNSLEAKLPENMFFRINRKQIINLNYIDKIESYFKGGLHVTLTTGQSVEVSTRQAVKFKERTSL